LKNTQTISKNRGRRRKRSWKQSYVKVQSSFEGRGCQCGLEMLELVRKEDLPLKASRKGTYGLEKKKERKKERKQF